MNIYVYQQQQQVAAYEISRMQTGDKLNMLLELLQLAELEPHVHELIHARIEHVQQFEHYYTHVEGEAVEELRIEPYDAGSAPAEKREIYLKEITSEDVAWTGIYFSSDHQRPRFQTFYQCECGMHNTIYVYDNSKTVNCQNCKQKVKIRPATQRGRVKRRDELQAYRDELGNYFISDLE